METSRREPHQQSWARPTRCHRWCQGIGTGRRTWWKRWCAGQGPARAPTPASTEATVCGCCGRHLPVLRCFQESLRAWLTSLLTLPLAVHRGW